MTVPGSSSLRYRLLRGPVALEAMRVLACRRFAWAGGDACAYVLGASHAVVLRHAGREWVEMLTCVPPPRDGSACSPLLTAAVPDTGASDVVIDLPTEGEFPFRGMVRLQRFTLLPHGRDALHMPLDPANCLTHEFPARDACVPRTRLGWNVSGSRLAIETVHTYPEEGCGIRSETLIHLPGGGDPAVEGNNATT